MKLLDALIDLL